GDIGILNSLAIGQAIGFEPFAPLLTVGGGVGGGPGGSGKSGGNGKGSGAPSGTSPHGTGTDPIQLVGYSPSTGNGGGVAPNDPPPTPVNTLPEPGALALLAAGLFGLAGVMALRRRQ
ncbi:MAG TPA: PEP-CTERM sorting domain-containing protein, partial [Stellaceae bacterium]|nr:PEP-CTERM sorting domain-containing protein [Stellaceae bacterium]